MCLRRAFIYDFHLLTTGCQYQVQHFIAKVKKMPYVTICAKHLRIDFLLFTFR